MKKILSVDDEFLIRFTLEEGLKDRGYETQSAETVKDALEKRKTFHPQRSEERRVGKECRSRWSR